MLKKVVSFNNIGLFFKEKKKSFIGLDPDQIGLKNLDPDPTLFKSGSATRACCWQIWVYQAKLGQIWLSCVPAMVVYPTVYTGCSVRCYEKEVFCTYKAMFTVCIRVKEGNMAQLCTSHGGLPNCIYRLLYQML